MWRFWLNRGYLSLGRALLAEQLALPCEPPAPAPRARCLQGAAMLAFTAGDLATALRCSEESVAIRRLIGDRIGTAGSLGVLGSVLSRQGEFSAARSCHEESLAIHREIGSPDISAQLGNFGVFLQRTGDLEGARVLHEEAMALSQARGDRKGQGGTLMNLADIAFNSGALAKSHELYEEAANVFQEIGSPRLAARASSALAMVMCDEGDPQGAQALFQTSLETSLKQDDLPNVCDSLYGLGDTFSTRDPRRAATLWGAGQRLRESVGGGVIPAAEQARDDALFARARTALGDDAEFDRAWAEGRTMPLAQAVAYALRSD
jgi:tetratricopeptide (TPR) repeat protein